MALLIVVSFAGALTAGWYGRRAAARIRHWGEKMNEVDEIFRSAVTAEEMAGYSVPPQNESSSTPAVRSSRVAVGFPR
jgi:hypothetical protein